VESRVQDESAAARDLVAILRLAYSGELAAALAYRGHWRSLAEDGERGDQRRQIRKIEEEELHHRRQLREMLRAMGCAPRRFREARAWLIGRVLGALCHVSGWLIPMYGAGKLESRNVREYEAAARHAFACRRHEWIDCLLTMAEVEWDHEAYFRARVLSHPIGRRLPLWAAPPPKAEIRRSFEREFGLASGAALVRSA
jgi:demethoxyubiquinone hydroxylase (CLK1/Coq7/Cat5 family)